MQNKQPSHKHALNFTALRCFPRTAMVFNSFMDCSSCFIIACAPHQWEVEKWGTGSRMGCMAATRELPWSSGLHWTPNTSMRGVAHLRPHFLLLKMLSPPVGSHPCRHRCLKSPRSSATPSPHKKTPGHAVTPPFPP